MTRWEEFSRLWETQKRRGLQAVPRLSKSAGPGYAASSLVTDSFRIADDSNDRLGIYNPPSGGTEIAAWDGTDGLYVPLASQGPTTGDVPSIGNVNSGDLAFFSKLGKFIDFLDSTNTFYNMRLANDTGILTYYARVATAGLGVSAIYGTPDWRTGVLAADGAPLTIYTTTAAAQVYKLFGRVYATTLGGGGAVSYVLKWTEGAVTITKTLTVNAVDVDAELTIPIQPDNATAITAQITALSGAATAANVAGWVEEVK